MYRNSNRKRYCAIKKRFQQLISEQTTNNVESIAEKSVQQLSCDLQSREVPGVSGVHRQQHIIIGSDVSKICDQHGQNKLNVLANENKTIDLNERDDEHSCNENLIVLGPERNYRAPTDLAILFILKLVVQSW